MAETSTSAHTDAQQWASLAAELGINATVAGPGIDATERSRLDVISAELLLPEGEEDAIVILRVKTQRDRVLELDMALPLDGVVDASDDYDLVDGELIEHHFDLSRSDEVERYFGRRRST